MAINFPDSPTNGQTYTDSGTGQTWTYELATNSWTASSLAVTGGVVYKGSVNITAAPPTGAKAGEQWSVGTGGTANAGYGPGVTGAITKGSMVMYTGAGWLETSHSIPDATTLAKGIDTLKWNRTGTVLSPATAGDVVNISAGTAALPSLTPVGDADSGLFSPGADQIAVSTGGSEKLRVTSAGRVGIGTSAPSANLHVNSAGNTVAKVSSTYAGSPATGYAVDTAGDASIGRFYFQKSGVVRGSVNYYHDATGTAELMGFTVAGGTSDKMVIDGKGNVGIGTASPSAALEINAAAATSPFIAKINTTEAMRIKPSGIINFANVPIYIDIAAAQAGGLVTGDVFRNTASMLVIVS